jgi:hypothetical protein
MAGAPDIPYRSETYHCHSKRGVDGAEQVISSNSVTLSAVIPKCSHFDMSGRTSSSFTIVTTVLAVLGDGLHLQRGEGWQI